MAEPTHGKVILTLDEYRLSRNISKNKIVQGARVQRTQLQNYCNNIRLHLWIWMCWREFVIILIAN